MSSTLVEKNNNNDSENKMSLPFSKQIVTSADLKQKIKMFIKESRRIFLECLVLCYVLPNISTCTQWF